jgi:hypothetical protein
MTSILSMTEIGTLDRQIAQLHDYKPIPENEVKNLCDKVSLYSISSPLAFFHEKKVASAMYWCEKGQGDLKRILSVTCLQ